MYWHTILSIVLLSGPWYYYFHFADEKTDAGACPIKQLISGRAGREPRQSRLRALLSNTAATGHVWLLRTWNAVSPHSDVLWLENTSWILRADYAKENVKFPIQFSSTDCMLKWEYLGHIGFHKMYKLTYPGSSFLLSQWLLENLKLHAWLILYFYWAL